MNIRANEDVPVTEEPLEADPALVELVSGVANRFGVDGLDQMVALAAVRRAEVVAALVDLKAWESGAAS